MSTGSWGSFLGQLLNSREFSDATFVCCGEEFRVHKAIVCTQSAPIRAALQGGFKESKTNRIEMDKFHPGTVKRMVQFMYTGDYDDPDGKDDDDQGNPCADEGDGSRGLFSLPLGTPVPESSAVVAIPKNIRVNSHGDYYRVPEFNAATRILLEHIRVNSIGDYYQVVGLVSLANSKIKQLLQNHSEGESWVESLPAAIDEAAETTGDKEILEILAEAATSNISHLLGMKEFRSLPVMSEFASDFLQVSIRKNQVLERELEETQRWLCLAEQQSKAREEKLERAEECLRVLSKTVRCSQCSAEFLCDCISSFRGWYLRCRRCRRAVS